MKRNIIKSLLSICIIALAGCSDIPNREASPEVSPNCNEVFFNEEYSISKELDPNDPTSVEIEISRKKTADNIIVPITVLSNQDNTFIVPETVTFSAGEATSKLIINFPEAPLGISQKLSIALDGEDVNPYTTKYSHLQLEITRVKWDLYAEGIYYCNFFDDSWEVELYKADGDNKYKLQSIFEEGYHFTFEVDSKGYMTPAHPKTGDDLYSFDAGFSYADYGLVTMLFDNDPDYSLFDEENKVINLSFKYTVSAGSFGWFDDTFTWE